MDLSAKLQIKPGQSIAVLNRPPSSPEIEAPGGTATPQRAEVVFVFARSSADLDTPSASAAVEAALADKLVWIAYPKAGKLGTDLSRDVLVKLLSDRGVQPVRQVAVDDVWSALRFRPA
ncbi:hypothetical protein GCM10023322_73990 [Rugosimonospora acidiphila]|uniref:DUF3052 domain-containing protein n=1 Tax=Rugosimonospora acidiphila TaxID=556531 RepID=A0ABP9SMH0_9ACTN